MEKIVKIMKKITVKKVRDGDTFRGPRDKFYRLAEVYAPEKGQKGYKRAKETLKEMIEGEQVYIQEVGKSYNRPVVKVRLPGEKRTINEKMKRVGFGE